MKISVAPRCCSFSMTNDPRKPPPPVTITSLFCQKFSAMISPELLHNELSIPILFIGGIANDPGLQCEQQFTDAVVHVQGRVKAKYSFDFCERHGDITHVTTEGQVFIFNS